MSNNIINTEKNCLKKSNLENLKKIEDCYLLIEEYPKSDDLTTNTIENLKIWFINTIENINTWFNYHKKSKLEYRNMIQLLSFKLKEVVIYYNDFTTSYEKLIEENKTKTINKLNNIDILIYWKDTCDDHLQKLLDGYSNNYSFDINTTCENKCKLDDSLLPIKELLDKSDLTEQQYLVIRDEYLCKLNKINKKKNQYKCLYNGINSLLQVSSVILPTIITFKDTQKIENHYIKSALDYTAIGLAVLVGLLTNFNSFFKINQKYSLYTQYNNKFRQEIRRYLTSTEKYKSDEYECYQLFPKFSKTIEEHIEDMGNLEHDLIKKNRTEELDEEIELEKPTSSNKEDATKEDDLESNNSEDINRFSLIRTRRNNINNDNDRINNLNNTIRNLKYSINTHKYKINQYQKENKDLQDKIIINNGYENILIKQSSIPLINSNNIKLEENLSPQSNTSQKTVSVKSDDTNKSDNNKE